MPGAIKAAMAYMDLHLQITSIQQAEKRCMQTWKRELLIVQHMYHWLLRTSEIVWYWNA
jgi:hypothetical protein